MRIIKINKLQKKKINYKNYKINKNLSLIQKNIVKKRWVLKKKTFSNYPYVHVLTVSQSLCCKTDVLQKKRKNTFWNLFLFFPEIIKSIFNIVYYTLDGLLWYFLHMFADPLWFGPTYDQLLNSFDQYLDLFIQKKHLTDPLFDAKIDAFCTMVNEFPFWNEAMLYQCEEFLYRLPEWIEYDQFVFQKLELYWDVIQVPVC